MHKHPLLHVLALVAILAAGVLCLIFLPIKQYLDEFTGWVRDLGAIGPLAVVLLYIPACLLLIPMSILALTSGFLFGIGVGAVVVVVGSTLGAWASFLLGRTLVRGVVEDQVVRHPRFATIDQVVSKNGFKIVALTRLSPIFPFNFLNYAFGITNIRLSTFLWATFVGHLPLTVLYVYFGATENHLIDLISGKRESGTLEKVVFIAGLVVAVAVFLILIRMAHAALKDALPPDSKKEDG